ncbi:MAG: hypothetical protein E6415_13910 [Intestinibacter bartlettii]|uniref:hypothetical protein n=1 Tax=Intestinibacter bartlettii TaxID=261299 RepID=UPI0029087F8E|nr:hypothetical protein [Intestinibacter bartlettii]MDU6791138.1 hypothetical protein [Anaerococcus sp.]MDU6824385.1 hypothetical protein [Intestinibacter bartlettii]
MEWTIIASALIKNGPLVVIAAIFLKVYMEDTTIKRSERAEDRKLQKENNEKILNLTEKVTQSIETNKSEVRCLGDKLEVHNSSSGASLAEIKQGVNQIQKDVTILNSKIDDIAEDIDKSA